MGRDLRIWCVFGLAIVGVSSAGSLLASMDAIPPLLRACWRLQATVLVLVPGFVIQWRGAAPEIREKYLQRRHLGWMAASGGFLALHFALWVASIDRTSLAHSLLFVTAHPVLLVTGMILVGRTVPRGAILGSLLGFAGAAITLLDLGSGEQEVTLIGDGLALAGGAAVIGYFLIGRKLRLWMPLFLYATPVTAVAMVMLLIGSALIEPNAIADAGAFGWLAPEWVATVSALAIGAGLIGHTGLNASLRHMDPLIVSVGVTLEPVLGVLIDRLLFATEWPGPWTVLGGTILLIGLVLVARNEPTGRGNDSTSSEA